MHLMWTSGILFWLGNSPFFLVTPPVADDSNHMKITGPGAPTIPQRCPGQHPQPSFIIISSIISSISRDTLRNSTVSIYRSAMIRSLSWLLVGRAPFPLPFLGVCLRLGEMFREPSVVAAKLGGAWNFQHQDWQLTIEKKKKFIE